MRAIVLICLGLTVSLPAIAASNTRFPAQSEHTFREECSAYSEAGMRDCLAAKVRESQHALKQAEERVSAALSKWDEDAKYINLAKTRFVASKKAFAKYREAQCAFAASLGGGAIGNALEMGQLACAAELNGRRAEQLRGAVSDLPLK